MSGRIRIAHRDEATDYIGVEGELSVDLGQQMLFVHDGHTVGGHSVSLSVDEVEALITAAFEITRLPQDVKAKLEGLAEEASKNLTDAWLLSREHHTGTQSAETITGLKSLAFRTPGFPSVNLDPHSGRFAGKINPFAGRVTKFEPCPLIVPSNGTVVTEVGKFIYDNNNYGGGAGWMHPEFEELLSSMGITGYISRYGVEYYIAKYMLGSGRSSASVGTDGVTRYLLATSDYRLLFGVNNRSTFVAWLKATGVGSISIGCEAFIDGQPWEAYRPLPSGWHHVRYHFRRSRGYDNALPRIMVEAGGGTMIALPAFFNGDADPGIHTRPLTSINGLNA